MADTDTQPRPIRFEDFKLDTRAGELRKAGVKLKLTGQPLLVLAALLEGPATWSRATNYKNVSGPTPLSTSITT
jgi:DNA-binding response OmpR family regulator